ncbi:F-box only protein 2-like [Erpetoichthys calabaricus]|uniref:F-box only protein 2-like n=1 Tax=Erpetoichthys calabaricus TaxID=27687 RepID=A0A8C4X268_ERPCA|nr:F-box only protein 2-like [Erpetoichthys calabaricus]
MHLLHLPDEVLRLIFSHVPASALLTRCQYVCKRWHDILSSQAFWKFKYMEDWPHFGSHKMAISTVCNWKKICLKDPFRRNLIKNPCGEDSWNSWRVHNGGDGWSFIRFTSEDLPHVCSAFGSSFHWSVKSQTIDLIEEGLCKKVLDEYQPEIAISDWYSAYIPWGGEYKMTAKLLGHNQRQVIQEFHTEGLIPGNQPEQCWVQVQHVFTDYGTGVRYVKFQHMAKDILYWKGHYGAWVTNSSVTVRLRTAPQK